MCLVDGEDDGILQLADVRQGGVRHGRTRSIVGLSVEHFAGRISREFARICKLSGLATIRQGCREIERNDSSKTHDVKKYSNAELFYDLSLLLSTKFGHDYMIT
jgi:hypothetical protein